MSREGVWDPNGEGEQPDVPGGIAKDNARAKQPVIAYACLYQRLAVVAREHGYALAMHGSLVADCDLIAVPWVASAATHDALASELAKAAGGLLILDQHADRVAGVRKHVIHLGGGPYLDLAVVPALAAPPVPEGDKKTAVMLEHAQHYIDRLALCADHRDKATGRCVVCQAEERTRQEVRRTAPAVGQDTAEYHFPVGSAAPVAWEPVAIDPDYARENPNWQQTGLAALDLDALARETRERLALVPQEGITAEDYDARVEAIIRAALLDRVREGQ